MPRMQQVEATVGEDQPLAHNAPSRGPCCELRAAHDLPASDIRQRQADLGGLDCHSAHLGHGKPGGDVGDFRGLLQGRAGRQRRGHHGDCRVPGAGDVGNRAAHGRNVLRMPA